MIQPKVGRRPALLGALGSLAAVVARAQGSAGQERANGAPRSRVVILGSKGGPRMTPQGGRGMTANLIVAGGVPYVVDCGYGVTEKLVRAGIPLPRLRHIFLTHQHSDHNIEYANLFLLAWASGLSTRVDTWGPPPIAEMTRLAFEINAADIAVRMEEEGRPDPRKLVVAHELPRPGPVMQDDNVRVTSALVLHGPVRPAYALRFDMADRSVVFSGDTTYSENLATFAKGADLLIHEVMYLPGIDKILAANSNAPMLRQHLLDGHTLPEDVGRIAAAAGVKRLVLSHLVPGDDPSISDEMWLAGVRKHYDGPAEVARDMMEL
jgi:ribonuclease BN (tRNA processing enzyme)